jgi:hypothetical protein
MPRRFHWTLASIAGCVSACGTASVAHAAIKGQDTAANAPYTAEVDGAWKGENSGADENPPGTDNGGTGFLPWSFGGGYNPPGGPYGTLNHFIAGVDFPSTSYNNLGAPAFGLGNAAPPGSSGATTTATRPFAAPLAVGDIFTAEIDTPAELDDYTLFNYPFAIISFSDDAGAQTFSMETGSSAVFGDFNWRYKDGVHTAEYGDFGVDAGGASIPPSATNDGSTVRLEVLTATTGRVTLDGVPLDITFAAGLPKSVTFTLFDNNAVGPLYGDFDGSLQVDGADLTQWKGDFASDVGSDADGDGDTDGEDFLLWQRNVGALTGTPTGEHAFYFDNLKIESPGAVGAAAGVPEPASALLCVLGLAAIAGGARARRAR